MARRVHLQIFFLYIFKQCMDNWRSFKICQTQMHYTSCLFTSSIHRASLLLSVSVYHVPCAQRCIQKASSRQRGGSLVDHNNTRMLSHTRTMYCNNTRHQIPINIPKTATFLSGTYGVYGATHQPLCSSHTTNI